VIDAGSVSRHGFRVRRDTDSAATQIWTTGVDRDFLIAVLALVGFSAATAWLCRHLR
jgi:hypothetical protein